MATGHAAFTGPYTAEDSSEKPNGCWCLIVSEANSNLE